MKHRHKVDIVGRRYHGGGGGELNGLCFSVLRGNCSALKRGLCPSCHTRTPLPHPTSAQGQPHIAHPWKKIILSSPVGDASGTVHPGAGHRHTEGMECGVGMGCGIGMECGIGIGYGVQDWDGDGSHPTPREAPRDLPKVDLRPGRAACLVCRLCSTLLSKCPAVQEGGISGVT